MRIDMTVLERLQAREITPAEAQALLNAGSKLGFRTNHSGGVLIDGLRRFPVHFYGEELEKLYSDDAIAAAKAYLETAYTTIVDVPEVGEDKKRTGRMVPAVLCRKGEDMKAKIADLRQANGEDDDDEDDVAVESTPAAEPVPAATAKATRNVAPSVAGLAGLN